MMNLNVINLDFNLFYINLFYNFKWNNILNHINKELLKHQH